MLIQTRYCGYCEEPLLMDTNTCVNDYCVVNDPYYFDEPVKHIPMAYGPTALMEAQAFMDKHPEFRTRNAFNQHNKVGAYDTQESKDYDMVYDLTSEGLAYDYDMTEDQYSREAEWDAIYANRDNYQIPPNLNGWRDVEPKRCTHATYWWSNKPGSPAYPMPYADKHLPKDFTDKSSYEMAYDALDYSDQNLNRLSFIELQGFAAQQLIDLSITEKYQYKLFNVYVGRDNNLHCGLLTIASDAVTCSKSDCYYRTHALPIPCDPTREEMEEFVSALIRHGNNHGPNWYVRRQDFTYIHATNCDGNHNQQSFCNANAPKQSLDMFSLSDAIEFLIRHRKFCRDSKCRCGAYYHTLCHYERELQVA